MLPASEGWQRLHPLSPLIRGGRIGALALFAFVQQGRDLPAWAGPAAAATAAAVIAAGSWWTWRSTGYRLDGEVLELRTGAIFRRHRRVPLARIESVDIARPFLARFFALVEVRVEAVSQGASEVRLSFLPEDAAAALRAQLTGTSAAAVTDEPLPTAPAVRVPDRELVWAYVAAPLAGLVLLSAPPVLALVAGGTEATIGGLAASTAGLIASAGTLLLRAERLHGFSLVDVPEGLRLRRGLLNELHQTVPLARVQAVRIEEPALWRPFRRARLLVDVAGYRGGDRQARQETAVLLPVATWSVVADVMRRVFPDVTVDEMALVPAPGRARWRAPVRWRSYGVQWTATHAIARSGLVRRRTDIVPHAKVQSLRVTDGPWQRRLGLATLHADTAGVAVTMRAPHRARDEAERLAWTARAAATSGTSGK